VRSRWLDDCVSANRAVDLKPVSKFQDLLNQLIAQLRASLDTEATEEQIREAAATLIELDELIDADMLISVGTVIFDNPQALAKADPNLLNAIVQQARAAQLKENIRRPGDPN
jgi:hypothetical protein